MLKLKLWVLWPPDAKSWFIGKRPWCWERLKAGGEGDNGGWDGWMASLTQWTWDWVNSREAWHSEVHWVAKSWTQLSDWTEQNWALQSPLSNIHVSVWRNQRIWAFHPLKSLLNVSKLLIWGKNSRFEQASSCLIMQLARGQLPICDSVSSSATYIFNHAGSYEGKIA